MHVALILPDQHESLVALLCELNEYYNVESSATRDAVRTHLHEHLLAEGTPLRLVVACDSSGRVLGFAAIAILYSLVEPSPPNDKQCLVKELFVGSSSRSQGVGRSLMAWVARYAIDQGCGRIDWNVKASNVDGGSFYRRLGAEVVSERVSYRLAGPSMAKLARESEGEVDT